MARLAPTSAVVIGLATLITIEPAAAQPSHPAVLQEVMRPDVLMRDARYFAEALDLEGAQSEIVRALIIDYNDDLDQLRIADWFDQARPVREEDPELAATRADLQAQLRELLADDNAAEDDAVRRRIEEIKTIWRNAVPEHDQEAERAAVEREAGFSIELARQLAQWTDLRQRFLADFLTDVASILSETQREAWPAVERRFVRRISLARGRLSGERVDLTTLVGNLSLTNAQKDALAPLVTEYEVVLDAALRSRDRIVGQGRAIILDAHASGRTTEAVEHMALQMSYRVAVRDVNDLYVEIFAEAIPADVGSTLMSTYARRAYPKAYRPIGAQRRLATLLRRGDLDAERRADAEALSVALEAELQTLRGPLISAIRNTDVTTALVASGGRPDAGAADHLDLERLFEAQAEIGRRFDSRLDGLLAHRPSRGTTEH